MTTTVMTQKKLAIALLAAMPVLAGASSLSAEDTDTLEDEVIELEDAYVRPDYVEIERLRNTKEILVITKEEIQNRGMRTISDALTKVPSISVGSTGQGEIDIRGQGADVTNRNIQVLVDGVPITPLTSHPTHTNIDVLPIEQVERIEIIPGGGSVLYGSGAAGGIVNITSSLKKLDEPALSVSGELNSKGGRGSASIGANLTDRLTLQINGTKIDRDLYFVDTFRNTENLSAGIRWDITDSQTVTARVDHLDEESVYINNVTLENVKKYGKNYRRKASDYLHGDRRQDRYSVSYLNDLSETLHWSNDVYMNDGFFMGTKYEDKKMNEEGWGLRSKLEWQYADWGNMLFGLDYRNQEAELNYFEKVSGTPTLLSFNYKRETAALFVSNSIKYEAWESTQGFRRELTKWNFNKPLDYKADAKYGQFEDSSDRWNSAWELSLAYHYRPTGRVFGRYERGYTTPDGIQITDEHVSLVNGTLVKSLSATKAEDETYDMFEIGLNDKIAFTTVGLTLWYSQTDNAISRPQYYEHGKSTRTTQNLFNTKRWGADLTFMQQFDRLTLEESYAYLKGETEYNSEASRRWADEHLKNGAYDFISAGLKKVPKHKFSMSATYELTDWLSGNLRYTWQGKYQNIIKHSDLALYNGEPVVGDYELVDLSLKWTPNRYIEVNAGVTNLLDELYGEYNEETTFVPGPGRTYFIGLKATY